MLYQREIPAIHLQQIMNCYWHIDSRGDSTIMEQKIVPDGYPEIILHYGDPYEINISGSWERQSRHLLAGQIKKHFYLRNTGVSGMIGIKFQPAALTYLFDIDHATLTGKVVPLPEVIPDLLQGIVSRLSASTTTEVIFEALNDLFLSLSPAQIQNPGLDKAIDLLLSKHGNVNISELCVAASCSERQLERLFKRFVGLTPKFYARIIRLAYIFELMQEGNKSWSDLVYDSGFYDQSHFIKNFKEFTGEDPSAYGFEEKNMANFHLQNSISTEARRRSGG